MKTEAPERSDLSSRLVLWTALAILVAQLLTRSRFLIEDAFIAFRYARNWVEWGVPAWNPGELPPVEGHSTVLWVLVLRACYAIGLDLPLLSQLLGGLLGCLTTARLHRFLLEDVGIRRTGAALGVFALVLSPPFVIWCSGGLETSLQTWLMLTLFAALLVRGSGADLVQGGVAGLAAVGLALTRPEGAVWVLGLVASAVLATRLRPAEARPGRLRWLVLGTLFTAGLVLLLVWRRSTHGAWLPNTVAAKSGLDAAVLWRGLACTASWALLTILPLVVLVIAPFGLRGPRRAPLAGCLVVLAGGVAYNVAVGGDWMPYFRFFAPVTPFLAAALALSLGHLPGRGALAPGLPLVLLGALPLSGEFDRGIWPQAILEKVYFRSFAGGEYRTERQQFKRSAKNLDNFRAIGRALGALFEPEESIVMGAIGAIGWESRMTVLDRNGLVDPRIAALPRSDQARSAGHDRRVPRAWFLSDRPTLVQALIVPDSALVEDSPSFDAAVRASTRLVLGQDPTGEAPLLSATIAEVLAVPPDVEFPAGHALLVWRTTTDTERAQQFWRKYGLSPTSR